MTAMLLKIAVQQVRNHESRRREGFLGLFLVSYVVCYSGSVESGGIEEGKKGATGKKNAVAFKLVSNSSYSTIEIQEQAKRDYDEIFI